jgi:hypothetical protein
MAIFHEALQAITEALTPAAQATGLTRLRGGMARGAHWAEMSGRHVDGAWYEMRLHVHQDGRLMAGLLAYQPLSRGGRTHVVGEHTYESVTPESISDMVEVVGTWLARISPTPTTT